MTHPHGDTTWRATGPYLPTNASKTGLLDETRQFLVTYARRRDVDATARELLDGALPQRSRETRRTIVRTIDTRLTRWNPPDWVLSDLVAFAAAHDTDTLKSALLLHAARQDVLLVDAVLHVIVPRWAEHTLEISRADVQRYLDAAEPLHPEIAGWSRETREKLTGNRSQAHCGAYRAARGCCSSRPLVDRRRDLTGGASPAPRLAAVALGA